ncbi:MAG: hypothetical protein ABIR15_07765 [Chitinophagaceae bacterium]
MKFQFIIITAVMALSNYNAVAQKKTVKNSTIHTVKPVHQKEHAFGLAVFTALQNKDTAAWLALYPTNEEYGSILQAGLAAKAEGLTQQIIDDILIRRKNEAAAAYSSQFKQYCNLADSMGVIWKDAVFQKFDFEEVYPEPVKLKYLGAVIRFNCEKKIFVIGGIQAVEIKSGIKLQSLEGIRQLAEGE